MSERKHDDASSKRKVFNGTGRTGVFEEFSRLGTQCNRREIREKIEAFPFLHICGFFGYRFLFLCHVSLFFLAGAWLCCTLLVFFVIELLCGSRHCLTFEWFLSFLLVVHRSGCGDARDEWLAGVTESLVMRQS
jgi:hypothetical protein